MRKIRINLYSKEFRPKTVILSLQHMIIIWVSTAVIVSIVCFFSAYKLSQLKVKENELKNKISRVDNDIFEIQSLVAAMEPDKLLESNVEKLKNMRDTKQKFMDFLSSHKELKNAGYASFLESLAKIQNPNISITEFTLHDLKVEIKGIASKGSSVPEWISQFNNYDELRNISFGSISITKNENNNNYVNFSLLNPVDPIDKEKEAFAQMEQEMK